MRNIFINNYKRKKLQNLIQDGQANEFFVNNNSTAFDSVTSQINEKDIRKAISELTDEYKTPFQMFVEGFHYDEIAEHMGIPMGTVKSRIFHARKKLAASLSDFS
jgi:RNA polymerase sigma-70 factor (ECF subfamily)